MGGLESLVSVLKLENMDEAAVVAACDTIRTALFQCHSAQVCSV